MNYSSDLWLGYLCENLIRQIVEMARLRCDGCRDGIKSDLLHQHMQLNLLEKMRLYFEDVRGTVLPTLPQLYDQFQGKLPHSNDLTKDKEIYINTARLFLLTITAEPLYYGRYINEFTDSYIDEGFKIDKKTKKQTKSKKSSQPTCK